MPNQGKRYYSCLSNLSYMLEYCFIQSLLENHHFILIMNLDAKNIVALKSREQALSYFQNGNVGRAFAHYLVALNLVPEWKVVLKGHFSSTLCE